MMKIETTLNINDEIYFILDQRVINSIVRQIKIEIKNDDTQITYLCAKDEKERQVYLKCDGNNAFKSKSELIKSL